MVVTGDRDSLQLVGGGTTVRLVSTKMGQTTYETYDTATFREKYGFDPIHLIDLKALMGDSSDNIPGVPGIGEKTAMQLLHDFGTVEGVYQHLDDSKIKKGARAKLEAGEQSAKDSYWLATIDRNAPLELDVENLPAPHMDEDALYDLLTRLEFKNFIKRLGLSGEHAAPRLPAVKPQRIGTAAAAFALLDGLTAADRVFTLVPETLGALCLLDGDTASVLFADDFAPEDWDAILRRLFDGSIPLVLHDAKPAAAALIERGIPPEGIGFDTCIAAYLIDPTQSGYDLPRVALAYCNTELPALDLDDPAAVSPLGGQEQTMKACAQHVGAVRAIYTYIYSRSSSSVCASSITKSSCRSCACWPRWKRSAARSRRTSCAPLATSWTRASACWSIRSMRTRAANSTSIPPASWARYCLKSSACPRRKRPKPGIPPMWRCWKSSQGCTRSSPLFWNTAS